MKQYSINIRTNGYEVRVGSVFGDFHELGSLGKHREFAILRDNNVVYTCICKDIEIVEVDDKINVCIYNRAFNY